MKESCLSRSQQVYECRHGPSAQPGNLLSRMILQHQILSREPETLNPNP